MAAYHVFITCFRHVTLHVWIAMFLAAASGTKQEPREYCQWETFNATCSPNQVILMESANYGRMRFGRCVKENHGNVGCSSNVMPQLDRKCSGRHTCQLLIPDPMLHNIHPCPKELVPYLEASYICLPVQTTSRKICLSKGGYRVMSPSGHLASATPIEEGVGTVQCPWIIHVLPGQKINLTLFAFGTDRHDSDGSDIDMHEECDSDVIISDSGRTRSISACGQLMRERLIYVSDRNHVELYIEHNNARVRTNFLLRYEAVGCPDLPNMRYSWSTRNGDTAKVMCNYTGETYFLSCAGSEWKGEMGNCTKTTSVGAHQNIEEHGTNFPYGVADSGRSGAGFTVVCCCLHFIYVFHLLLSYICKYVIIYYKFSQLHAK